MFTAPHYRLLVGNPRECAVVLFKFGVAVWGCSLGLQFGVAVCSDNVMGGLHLISFLQAAVVSAVFLWRRKAATQRRPLPRAPAVTGTVADNGGLSSLTFNPSFDAASESHII